jgi:cytochrome c oxidase subunit 2
MKPKKLIAGLGLAAAGAIVIASWTQKTWSITGGVRPAIAAEEPQVIEIKARKFQFSPAEITLKKGQPAILRLTTEDRTHGFLLKPLKIDTDIVPGKATDVAVTPTAIGQYTVICDHFCGSGHGNMKMKLTVVE